MEFNFSEREGAIKLPKITCALLFRVTVVFTLKRASSSLFNHIGIFPVIYSVDRCATMHQLLAQSLCKENSNMVAHPNDVLKLSIYLIDSSHLPSIYALAKDMAVSFPRIDWLNLWFER
jgi:hypothetical protein